MARSTKGPITKILDFGAPAEPDAGHGRPAAHQPDRDQRVEKVTDFLAEGQIVRVKVLETDEKGCVKLPMKALLDREPPREQHAHQE